MIAARLAAATLLALPALPAFAQDVAYELVNDSSATLVEFYTSPVSDPNWSPNLIDGSNALAPGGSGTVNITDGTAECDYDVRFVFDDQSELTDQVNICDLASYTLHDE